MKGGRFRLLGRGDKGLLGNRGDGALGISQHGEGLGQLAEALLGGGVLRSHEAVRHRLAGGCAAALGRKALKVRFQNR